MEPSVAIPFNYKYKCFKGKMGHKWSNSHRESDWLPQFTGSQEKKMPCLLSHLKKTAHFRTQLCIFQSGVRLQPLKAAWGHNRAVRWTLGQSEYECIGFRTPFYFTNISAIWNCPEMVLYLQMDLSFQEKKRFGTPLLCWWDVKQKPSLIFLGHPVSYFADLLLCPCDKYSLKIFILNLHL